MAKKSKKKVKKSTGISTMTFQLPKSLHARIKARRAKTGEPMRDFINNALEKALKRAA